MKTISSPLKMFVSYSHKDESFLKELKKHSVMLEKKGLLKEWDDRELVVGDHLHSEIKNHLLNADLVTFLVSVDFLSSGNCFEELMNTVNRLENGEVRIIPIIVRSCKWKDTPLSDYLAVPKDGKPISKYDDQDEAWVEVADSIERAANKYLDLKRDKETNNSSILKKELTLNSKFVEELSNTEVVFHHKNKKQIVLDDIFVFPDLKNIKQEYDEIEKIKNSKELTSFNNVPIKVLILGDEQSGKTSLAKILTESYYNQGYLPLLCNGQEIKSVDVNEIISKLILKQYADLTYDDYIVQKRQKILIIDDYHKLKLNIHYQKRFLNNVSELIDKLILISDSSIKYNEGKYIELSEYSQYEILPLGHLRRGELIGKWNSLGQIETIEIKELHEETDRIIHHVDSIIRKNIIPPKPIYVLAIIQLLDTTTPTDYSLTSYGHCYQSLIQMALKKSNIRPNDFDLYINYLAELAYFIFNTGNDSIDDTELGDFKIKYSTQYLISSHDAVINILLRTGILQKSEEKIKFNYRYIFYFYVAKYLADHIDLQDCKKEIERLFENIHMEKYANILIFLVHHSKDQAIIDEILLHASVVFDKTKEATLNKEDTDYLLDYIKSIPKLVIEQRNIEEERKRRLKIKDKLDNIDGDPSDLNSDLEDESDRALSDIIRSFRLIEIIGQILSNRYGSFTKEQLKNLSMSAYSSGLKFLNFFLITTRKNQKYILKFLRDIFHENTTLSDDDISEKARKLFLILCYGTSYSVIKKITDSLGSKKLMPIFNEISSNYTESPAIQLIHIAIQLEFTKNIPKKELSNLYLKLEGNPIAQRLLQELLIQHLYLNHVDYRERQWISDKLNLPIKRLQSLQSKTEYKM